jgi:hypothetical protein
MLSPLGKNASIIEAARRNPSADGRILVGRWRQWSPASMSFSAAGLSQQGTAVRVCNIDSSAGRGIGGRLISGSENRRVAGCAFTDQDGVDVVRERDHGATIAAVAAIPAVTAVTAITPVAAVAAITAISAVAIVSVGGWWGFGLKLAPFEITASGEGEGEAK